MTDREVMKLALDALVNNRYIIESEINPPEALEEVDVAIAVLRQELAQPEQEVSYTDIQMAELIMSDCGHSSEYTPLLNRIAGRLAKYRQALEQPRSLKGVRCTGAKAVVERKG